MLAEHKGSITVSALLGTGLVTLGVALTGLAGMGDDLRAASPPAARGPVYDDSTESGLAWREQVRQGAAAHHHLCTPEQAAAMARRHQRERDAAAAAAKAKARRPQAPVATTPEI